MSGEPQPLLASTSAPMFTALDDGPDPAIGRTLAGKYEIVASLGEGGMGRVYLAEQTTLGRQVAIKVLTDYRAVHRAAERFFREAQATASIGHPNIIEVLDFGHTDDGIVFIVMEYLDGEDLAATLDRVGRMPWQRAAHIVIQLCRALGAAHDKGIVHRDIKPENIFRITRGRDKDFIKVLDFGIAKLVRPTPANAKLTRTGSVFGTPAYMSPEQARGREIDHRADIYSVGVILYELVTGRVPYDGEEFLDIAMQHLHEPVVGPGSSLPPGTVPPGLDAIVIKAMAKERDQRYGAMEEIATALERLVRGGSGSTDPSPWSGEALAAAEVASTQASVPGGSSVTHEIDAMPRRGSATLAVALLAAVLVVGGIALAIAWPSDDAARQPTPTPTPAPSEAHRTGPEPELAPAPAPEPATTPPVDPTPAPTRSATTEPAVAAPADAAPRTRRDTLSNAQISAVMRKLSAELSFCSGIATGRDEAEVHVSFVVDGATGRVQSVKARGGGTGVETCVAHVLEGAQFPTFGAPTQRIRRKIDVQR